MGGSVSQITGVFSTPAARNPISAMMEAGYSALGYNVHFLNCDVAPLRLLDAINGARATGWLGFMVGDPHKRAVVTHLDGLAESAAVIGAATCAARRGDAFIGENTEGWAVIETLEDHLDLDGSRAVVLGAGQAARAVVVELARAGAAHITIVNRTGLHAYRMASLLAGMEGLTSEVVEWSDTYRLPPTTDVVVNATRIGAPGEAEDRPDLDPESLHSSMVVVDMALSVTPTQLVKEARSGGCPAIDGLDVLVAQGMLAIRLWTNADADATVMREALVPALARLT